MEVEIGGTVVTVDGWPRGDASPPSEVVVNGERLSVSVRVLESTRIGPIPPAPVPRVQPTPQSPEPAVVSATGTIVRPPMPGRVIELRVAAGDRVEKGQVLLVLEAMKMRNEVTAPVAGRVAELKVAPGANVRAKEELLRLTPD